MMYKIIKLLNKSVLKKKLKDGRDVTLPIREIKPDVQTM
jgi:hypothetical protein